MLKRIAKRLLAAAGIEIRRIPRQTQEFAGSNRVAPQERVELESLLHRFAETHPHVPYWSCPKNTRSYLTDKRLEFFHELIEICVAQGVHFDGKRIADVGAGTGYLLRVLGQRFPSATLIGFEPDPDITALARELCPTATFHDAGVLASDDVRADVVFCTEVLEHMTDPEGALRALLRSPAAGGWLVLTVPDGRTDTFHAGPMRTSGDAYYGHINFWSPESWSLFVRKVAAGHAVACMQLSSGENAAFIRQC